MTLELKAKKPEASNVYSFLFEPEEPLIWEAGQYMHYNFPHINEDDRGHQRWFTISTAPFEKNIQITTRFNPDRSSSFKQGLLGMDIGRKIEADDGPKGTFVVDAQASHHVFIAGGIGITPYRSMLAQLNHEDHMPKIDLFYANSDTDFVFDDELRGLEKKWPSFKIHKFVGDKRIQKEDLQPFVDEPDAIFYLSGPHPLVDAYEELLKSMDASGDRIKLDYFPGY
jgi:glycine betaine catabolism B